MGRRAGRGAGGAEYFFRLTATNNLGLTSAPSAPLGYWAGVTAPLAPTTLAVAPYADLGNNYSVALTWTIEAAGAATGGSPLTGYALQYALDPGPTFSAAAAAWCTSAAAPPACATDALGAAGDGRVGLVSAVYFDALKGTAYRFRIAAESAAGRSPWSDPVALAPLITAPQPPPRPAVVAVDEFSLRVSWAMYETCAAADPAPYNATFSDQDPRQDGGRRLNLIQFQTSVNGSGWRQGDVLTQQDARFEARGGDEGGRGGDEGDGRGEGKREVQGGW